MLADIAFPQRKIVQQIHGTAAMFLGNLAPVRQKPFSASNMSDRIAINADATLLRSGSVATPSAPPRATVPPHVLAKRTQPGSSCGEISRVTVGNFPAWNAVREKKRSNRAAKLALFLHLTSAGSQNERATSLGGNMTRRSFISTFAASTVTCVVVSAADVQTAQTPLEEFEVAVRDYAKVHRAVERQLPRLHRAHDVQEIAEHTNAMASALQAARAGAREGDVFTPAIGVFLRGRISDALAAHGFLPDDVIAASVEEADDEAPMPMVNGRFPWRRGAAMWPCVIDALPALPQELQYRIVGSHLVLVDIHADLVIDVLRNAVR